MRALFVCQDLRIGGAERQWATLIPELRDRGVETGVVCLASGEPLMGELSARGVPVASLHMRHRADPGAWRRALAFASPRPDVVISRGVSGQFVGAAIARRAGAPHVLNEHTPLRPDGSFVPTRPHQRTLTRAVARRVDAVIAVTERQVELLGALGYPRDAIAVVPNGIFEAELEGIERTPELESDGFVALCVAGLRPEKRVDVFIEAVRAARRENPGVRGYVAGEGRELGRLSRLAEGSGVELLGVRLDALELMLAADVVCLTSEAEALPMSVLEAMALGRPVVATDVGGTAAAVASGETGYLVAPGDTAAVTRALLDLAADPEHTRALGEAGRRRQRERFSGEAMVDGYLAALERVAERM